MKSIKTLIAVLLLMGALALSAISASADQNYKGTNAPYSFAAGDDL